jgi:N-sulfoglucosamine sulfohydrolase
MKSLLLCLFILAAVSSAYIRHHQPIAEQPLNILWISCEDMSPRLGCYGDLTVPTPNIDRLAREGVRFTNAFCTAGVCAPSRNAIITGMYQTTTGGHNMRTLMNTLAPEGSGIPKAYSIVPPPNVRAFPEYLRAANYYTSNNDKADYQFDAPPTVWDEVSNKAHWRNRPKTSQDKPFFAVFNSVITHESQVWTRADRPLRVDPATITVPPIYPDTKTVRQDMARFYTNISEMDDVVGDLLKQLEDDGLLDKTIIFFWSDHGDGLPYVKREITDRGLRVPLIVRFPDGKLKGTTRQDLVSMIDLAPTVLSLTNIRPPAHMQGQAFLGKYASKTPRNYVFAARDRIDSEYDRVRSVHDGRYQYVRNFRPELPPYMDIEYRKQQPMMKEMLELRDAGKLNAVQMQWFRPNKPAEELYDVKSDPYQLTNLIDQPQLGMHLKQLRVQMDNWLIETKDLGGTPEKDLVKQWWNGQPGPPTTANPVVSQKGDKMEVACATEGASIGYKISGKDKVWQVYQRPIAVQKGETMTAVAMRIGYLKSAEIQNVVN